jgi:4-diphosphocytidyl-2-C-methyl-D-erythritol kinase
VVLFPNCKINLGLNITSKRTDGYHNIETVFFPVHWCDVLEVIESSAARTAINNNTDAFKLHVSGLLLPGNHADNICVKALALLRKDFPSIPPVDIFLHKAIPAGAGLGGGSADGAFMLKLLNEKYKLQLSTDQLRQYAGQLGSDCAFFMYNQPCFATSRGEVLEPISLDLHGYTLVLINPGIHINTGRAFSAITPVQPAHSLKEIIQLPITNWKALIKNDFEEGVFQQHPALAAIKEKLYANGAVYSAMSGSGSTIYGFFPSNAVPVMEWDENYIQKIV